MRRAVQRALELDPSSAEAHAQFGTLLLYYDWDIVAAKREFNVALSLDSANGSANAFLAGALQADPALADSATRIQEQGIRLNPASLTQLRYATSTRALRYLPDAARRARCTAMARMVASSGIDCEANRLWAAGDTAGTRKLLRSNSVAWAAEHANDNGSAHAGRAMYLAQLGDTTGAHGELQVAIEKSAHEYVREDEVATAFFRLGDIERSIDWWRRSVESNGSQVIWLAKDPEFARLRNDPRIRALLVKAGVR